MILALQILLLLVLSLIAYQDVRERMVHWFLFPIAALCMGFLFLHHSGLEQYSVLVSVNLLLVTTVLSILFVYTKYLRGMEFLNVSFGLGDMLFFVAFALGFPTVTFLVLFTGSITFSLFIFLLSKKNKNHENVPLAGLMSFFLIGTYLISSFPSMPSLYIL